ncbi:MAG: hypothetical protein JNK10_04850 [Cyclobacteriaceae bacterium]|nr:hypothetical protein [Cyclobacteriaceae bacterium]
MESKHFGEDFLKSNMFKILLPLIVVWAITIIAKGGYVFGQFLYKVLH